MKNSIVALLAFCVVTASAVEVLAQGEPVKQTLFINVNVFDGKSDTLRSNRRVLVEDTLMRRSSTVADER